MAGKTWEIVHKFHHLWGLLLVVIGITALYLSHDTKRITVKVNIGSKVENTLQTNSSSKSRCNYFSGKWVYDNVSYPLYKESQCSFIEDGFACQKNGRPDSKYQNWRWQPHQCDIPRFNGKALLEKLRGKRLVYVGDSLNRNTYESMLCLIEQSLPPFSNINVFLKGNMYTFEIKEYNATIAFYWSPFLVESNGDDALNHGRGDRIIRAEAIGKHARIWNDADILVFDSYAWWASDQNFTLLWGTFESSDAVYKQVNKTNRAYEMALQTWSDWLEINLDRTRTKLFFMGFSPFHYMLEYWGAGLGSCKDQTEIVMHDEKVKWSRLDAKKLSKIVESTFHKLETRGVKVQFLDILRLSAYRKDAHASIYAQTPLDRQQHPSIDCIHWCLPGLPDVWNQILYAYIMDS